MSRRGDPIRKRKHGDPRTPIREIPPLKHEMEVQLRRTFEDFRQIEILDPTPEISAIVAWVRATDLDRATCEGAGTTP